MNGLETAIRNALDRSERADGQVRARIYQSARQALEAGLRKQGVSDNLVIMEQRKRLEETIRGIEGEEVARLAAGPSPSLGEADHGEPVHADIRREPNVEIRPQDHAGTIDPPQSSGSTAIPGDVSAIGGVTRSGGRAPQADLPPVTAPEPQIEADKPGVPAAAAGRRAGRRTSSLDVPPERAAKPRKRRGFVSHLVTWMVTLTVVAVGCWIFYQSGMVQSIVEEAIRAADRAGAAQTSAQGPSALSSRGGFSEDWAEIFTPEEGASFRPGAQAQAVLATGSEGRALKVTSADPGDPGDVAIEVPVAILRELAGKSSTLAITIQSAVDQPSQLSVRCDFGSLGACQRHRFTATQEKLDALFKVSFDRSLAPNAPGRLIVNSGVEGASRPVLIYSVRALPGQ